MKEEELEKQKKKRKIIIPRMFGGWAQGLAGGREGREGVPWACTILSNPDVQEMVISRPAESSALL